MRNAAIFRTVEIQPLDKVRGFRHGNFLELVQAFPGAQRTDQPTIAHVMLGRFVTVRAETKSLVSHPNLLRFGVAGVDGDQCFDDPRVHLFNWCCSLWPLRALKNVARHRAAGTAFVLNVSHGVFRA